MYLHVQGTSNEISSTCIIDDPMSLHDNLDTVTRLTSYASDAVLTVCSIIPSTYTPLFMFSRRFIHYIKEHKHILSFPHYQSCSLY